MHNFDLSPAQAGQQWPALTIRAPLPTSLIAPAVVSRIVVVVPANNEEALLPDCLRALSYAAAQVEVSVVVVVVLDDCDDNSAVVVGQAAREFGLAIEVVIVTARNVGVARAAGFQHAVDLAGEVKGVWLATTDADSLVPPDWLQRQLFHAAVGAQVVAGTITVKDWANRPQQIRELAQTAYHHGPHRHIHGANLSFAAAAYVAVGGFAPLATGEDVSLVTAFTAAGFSVCWARDLPVATSARVISRAPLGFADYLNNLGRNSETADKPVLESAVPQPGLADQMHFHTAAAPRKKSHSQ